MRTRPRGERSKGHANSIKLPILYFIKRKYVNLLESKKPGKYGTAGLSTAGSKGEEEN
jgi:hypothetical protein